MKKDLKSYTPDNNDKVKLSLENRLTGLKAAKANQSITELSMDYLYKVEYM